MFEHASKISQTNKNFSFGFSERLARREVDFSIWIGQTFGMSRTMVKMGENYDLIRKNRPF